MGRKSKKNQDRSSMPINPLLTQALGAGKLPPPATGHYQPLREELAPRKAGARLLPLQGAGGLRGLERTAPQPRQPPETIVRRAATTTPSGMRTDDSDSLQQQLLEKDETIKALEKKLREIENGTTIKTLEAKIRELEKDKETSMAAAASEVAALQSRLQATNEGFVAAENVIKNQDEQIRNLKAQLRGEAPPAGAHDAPVAAEEKTKPLGAREIAAAHVSQGMLWIDPWVKRGERIDQVRQMCTAGVRPQLMEVAQQGKQALLTGLVNLRDQMETTDDPKEEEALSFFRDFTDEVIKRS